MSIPLFGIDMFRIKVVVIHFPFLWLSCPHLFKISWNLCGRRRIEFMIKQDLPGSWSLIRILSVHLQSRDYMPSQHVLLILYCLHGFCGQTCYRLLQIDQLCTYLGKNLSWKHHIDHIIIKVNRTIGLIAKLRHFLPMHTLSMGSGL